MSKSLKITVVVREFLFRWEKNENISRLCNLHALLEKIVQFSRRGLFNYQRNDRINQKVCTNGKNRRFEVSLSSIIFIYRVRAWFLVCRCPCIFYILISCTHYTYENRLS